MVLVQGEEMPISVTFPPSFHFSPMHHIPTSLVGPLALKNEFLRVWGCSEEREMSEISMPHSRMKGSKPGPYFLMVRCLAAGLLFYCYVLRKALLDFSAFQL